MEFNLNPPENNHVNVEEKELDAARLLPHEENHVDEEPMNYKIRRFGLKCLPLGVFIYSIIIILATNIYIFTDENYDYYIFNALFAYYMLTFCILYLSNPGAPSEKTSDLIDAQYINLIEAEQGKIMEESLTAEEARLSNNLYTYDYEKGLIKEVKFCEVCKHFKYPRAHHSTRHGKCVFRMDHFCVFAGNIVGLYNFNIFIQYTVIALILAITLPLDYILRLYILQTARAWEHTAYLILTNLIIVLTVFALRYIRGLCAGYSQLIKNNMTHIEEANNHMFWAKCRHNGVEHGFIHLYTRNSLWENVTEMMGRKCIYWFFPIPNKNWKDSRYIVVQKEVLQKYMQLEKKLDEVLDYELRQAGFSEETIQNMRRGRLGRNSN